MVVAELNADAGERVAASLRDDFGADAFALTTDVSDKEQVVAMIEAASDRWGTVDILVNNAWGGGSLSRVEFKRDSNFEIGFGVGFYGPFWAMQAAFPLMKAQGRGNIINLCSLNGVNAHIGTAEYNSAKEALRSLSRTAAREWAPHGIIVNVICPAAKSAAFRAVAARNPELVATADSANPMGYLGDPERDIAPVALFLASDDCALPHRQHAVRGWRQPHQRCTLDPRSPRPPVGVTQGASWNHASTTPPNAIASAAPTSVRATSARRRRLAACTTSRCCRPTSSEPSASTRTCSSSRSPTCSRTATTRARRTSSSTSATATRSPSSTCPGSTSGRIAEVLGGLHHLAISVEPHDGSTSRTSSTRAGIPYAHIDGSSIYFNDPDGAPPRTDQRPAGRDVRHDRHLIVPHIRTRWRPQPAGQITLPSASYTAGAIFVVVVLRRRREHRPATRRLRRTRRTRRRTARGSIRPTGSPSGVLVDDDLRLLRPAEGLALLGEEGLVAGGVDLLRPRCATAPAGVGDRVLHAVQRGAGEVLDRRSGAPRRTSFDV